MSTDWLKHLSPKQRSVYVDEKVLEGIPFEPERIRRKELFKAFEFSDPTLQGSVKRLEGRGLIKIDKKVRKVHYSRIKGANLRSSLEDIKIASTKAMLMHIKSGLEEIGKPLHIEDGDVGEIYYEIIKDCFKTLNKIYCSVYDIPPRNEDGELLYVIASDVDIFAIYQGIRFSSEILDMRG